jgi:Fe2+ or Zn2+ uptake regulation protein
MKSKAVVVMPDDTPSTFGWLQVEKSALHELQRLAIKSPSAMATLMFLTRSMTRTNALAVSQAVIAQKVGISIRSVAAAVKTLEKHRFIEVAKVGNMAVYNINTRLAWQGNRGERHAHFVADIIAVESEQSPELFEDFKLKKVPQAKPNERFLVGNEPIDPPDQSEMDLP